MPIRSSPARTGSDRSKSSRTAPVQDLRSTPAQYVGGTGRKVLNRKKTRRRTVVMLEGGRVSFRHARDTVVAALPHRTTLQTIRNAYESLRRRYALSLYHRLAGRAADHD